MVCPIIRNKLKTNHVVKNKNVMIEKGSNTLSFVCSLFFKISNPPKDARINPNSSG